MGTQIPHVKVTEATCRPMSIAAKRSPISASAELLLDVRTQYVGVCWCGVYIPAAGVRAGAARAAAAGEHVPAPSSAARRHTAAAVHPARHAHAPARNNRANSALHPSRVATSTTSFGWGKGWNVTSAGWQVTLCDPIYGT